MSLNFYCEEEENDREESINKYKNIFINFDKKTPSLSEALTQMFESSELDKKKVKELTTDIIKKCKIRINPVFDSIEKKYKNITKEDAYIICSYSCEAEDRAYSPYRILNQNLLSNNLQNSVNNISKYLYIFLKSLRKLPRYYPKNNKLYRCLTCQVNLSQDNNNIVPYKIGNKKTFWGFTSTSTDPKMTYSFLKEKEKIDPEFNEIRKKYKNITKEDAYIICSYTCESMDRKYSPYRILNQNLVSDNRRNGVRNISKYLYIFLKSLRKLPRYYPKNGHLYRCLTCKVNISKDPNNENLVPYITGNRKTFWGFTSTSPDPKMTYTFLGKEEKMKTGTIFTLSGDIWGYDIELFNYFHEKEILLEPERKFKVIDALPPVNNIIHVTCTIFKTPLIINNNETESDIILDEKIEDDKSINDSKMNKYVIKLEMEANINEKEEYTPDIGVLCNIYSKNLKALITYNHIIDFEFLKEGKKLILYINNKEKEIDLRINRYKFTDKDLDITIIEILEIDNVNNFIELDKFINSRNYTDEDIISISLKGNKNIDYSNGKIKKMNHNIYTSDLQLIKEGIIILKENYKLIGIIKDNNKNKKEYRNYSNELNN